MITSFLGEYDWVGNGLIAACIKSAPTAQRCPDFPLGSVVVFVISKGGERSPKAALPDGHGDRDRYNNPAVSSCVIHPTPSVFFGEKNRGSTPIRVGDNPHLVSGGQTIDRHNPAFQMGDTLIIKLDVCLI